MKFEMIVQKDEEKARLDVLVANKMPNLTRSRIKTLIENGEILLDGKKVKSGEKVKAGQKILGIFEDEKPLQAVPEAIDFEIVYEDMDLLVVNKPQGLVVHPCSSTKSGTLVNGLLSRVKDLSGINGVLRPGIVHRLDKNTSGLMVVAKNDLAHSSLSKQIKDKTCKRKYLALLEGNLKDDEGRIETYLSRSKKDRKKIAVSAEGKLAITDYKVIKRFSKNCLVEFSLLTGRTHQIRVHCAFLNHAIVGDDVYGHAEKALQGQLLHSYKLSFVHPRTNKKMNFEIPLPNYFDYYIKIRSLINSKNSIFCF